MKDKSSFILYTDIYPTVKKLPKELIGELFLAILAYVNDENPEPEELLVQVVFEPIKQSLKRDLKRWEKYIEKQSENGKMGGRPKKEITEPLLNETQKTQAFLEKPKKADSVSVSDSVIVNETDKITTFSFKNSLIEIGVTEKIASEWLLVRKAKKAKNTETAFNAVKREIDKSGLTANECITIAVERSWQGFNSEWIKDKNGSKATVRNNRATDAENQYTTGSQVEWFTDPRKTGNRV